MTATALATNWRKTLDEEWAQLVARYRVEHDRMRANYEAAGGEVGSISYVEDDSGDQRVGEWRSEILREAA